MRIRIGLSFLIVCCVTSVALAADQPGPQAASLPRVLSLTQLTHDGVSKTGLLTNDSTLFVTEWPAARHIVAKFASNGEGRSVLPVDFPNVQAFDLSPDRSKLLIAPLQSATADTQFWTLPVNSTAAEKLGEVTGRDASWSSDGRHLVFVKASTLFLANADGSGARELYTATGSVFAPHFSSDSKRIRFSVSDTAQNTTELWEIASDGSNPHALLKDWEHASAACCGRWTADGRYYIFQVTQTSPTTITTLWALRDTAHSVAPIELTNGPISFGNAAPTRDSKRILAIGVQPAAEAVKFNPASKEFASLLYGVSATDLDFSADGQWVTYISIPDGALWRSRADGTERMQLTFPPERAALPRWSPDGKQIAYVSMPPGKATQIAVISANGGKAEVLVPENRSQIDANWSADGTRIMFGYFCYMNDIDIRVVDLKTRQVSTLPGSAGLFSPRWSPNGRYVAALSPDFTKVMLFDTQAQKWSLWLKEAAGAVSYPVWAADSKYVYFDDLVTDEESIRRVKVGSDHTERVFQLEGIERYPGPFGLWSGRTPDGSYMFVRDRSTQEVYQLSVLLP